MKHRFLGCMLLALFWGIAASSWALDKVDGVYQIGSAQDLADFIALVNAGEKDANAVLTADIDYSDRTENMTFFSGTLDGQHHTIKVGWNNQPANHNALIYKHYGRVVNLCVEGTITTKVKWAAAIAQTCGGYIGQCVSKINVLSTVDGDGTHAGFAADLRMGALIENCAFYGSFSGDKTTNCGGIAGWVTDNSAVRNCLVIADYNHNVTSGTGPIMRHDGTCVGQSNNYYKIDNTGYTQEAQSKKVTAEEVASGDVVAKLNAGNEETVWMQQEGQLPMPWALEGSLLKTYEIGTPAELQAFAQKVNNYQNWHNAKLTADLDMAGAAFDLIGNDKSPFKGDFDGQGHWIKNLVVDKTGEDNVGFFRTIGPAARVHDLLFDENCFFKGKTHIGIIGHSTGAEGVYIYNVGNMGTVMSDGTSSGAGVGGIIGNANASSSAYIDRCFTTGNVTGTDAALISGWQGTNLGMVSNCWATGETSTGNAADKTLFRCGGAVANVMKNCFSVNGTQGKNFKKEDLASGALTYMINKEAGDAVWYQDLEKDAMPQLYGEKLVYQVGSIACDGTPKPDFYYSNEDLGSTQDDHDIDPLTGLCKHCGNLPTDADDYCLVGGAEALLKYAEMVNGGKLDLKVKLTADIDMTGKTWKPIGDDSHLFKGTIDGQRHIISNLVYEDLESGNPAGLVGTATEGAVFKDLILDETCSFTAASKYVGTFAGHTTASGVVTFDGCGTAATLEGTVVIKDGGVAGLTGNANSGSILHVENCWVAGKITGLNDVAAFSAWCGNVGAWMKNCWTVAELNTYQEGHYLARNGASFTIENCWTNENPEALQIQGTLLPSDLTTADVASGRLCYVLNGDQTNIKWYQNLGEDADKYPVAWDDHKCVYANGTIRCDGSVEDGNVTYANTQSTDKPDHKDDDHNGFCDVCGNLLKDFIEPVDGYYCLGSDDDLQWFAAMVEQVDNKLNARLTDDIYANGAFEGIGISKPYAGEFDGQDHTVSGISINIGVADAGFIRTAADGMHLHNVILEGFVRTSASSAGAVGGSQGSGNIKLTNVISKLDVEAVGNNAGGLIGCNHGSSAVYTFKDCGVMGNVKSGSEGGLIAGWAAHNATVTGCWSIATITGPQIGREFIRYGNDLNMSNNFAVGTEQVTTIQVDDAESGKLTWLLNGESFMAVTWYQTLGADDAPTWMATHNIVYQRGEGYESFNPAKEDEVAAFCQNVLGDLIEEMNEIIAQKSLVEAYLQEVNAMQGINTYAEFCKAYSNLSISKAKVMNSAKKYAEYKKVCDDILTFLDENPFACKEREVLEKYLNENVEPNAEEFANGSYPYIIEKCLLNEDQLNAEIEFVQNLKSEAVKHGYVPGSEISDMIANRTFAQDLEGWNLEFEGTHVKAATVKGVGSAVEAWNSTFDINQKITELQPGLYEVRVNAAYRPYNNIQSNLYAAQLYANNNSVYLMTEGEDYVSKTEAEDGVNCHLTGEAVDYEYVYGTAEGYVPRGPIGFAYAQNADRYVNRVVAEVREDGELTIGIKNPGSGLANDWTGFGNFRLFYLGTVAQATEGLDRAVAACQERGKTIQSVVPGMSATDAVMYPNYSADLQEELEELIAANAATNEEKVAQLAAYTAAFNQIYAERKAYAKMIEAAEKACDIASEMYNYGAVTDAELTIYNQLLDEAWTDFEEGNVDEAGALAYVEKCNIAKLLPELVDDYYQLNDAMDVIKFSVMVNKAGMGDANAKMNADMNFRDLSFLPIGYDASKLGNSDAICYKGTFDGQGHRISNLAMERPEEVGVGLFGTITAGAVIKNFVLDETCSISAKDRAGIVGRSTQEGEVVLSHLGNEGVVTAGIAPAGILGNANAGSLALIDNCYSTGIISGNTNAAQICGWFGSIGGNVTNCWSNATITGFDSEANLFYRTAGSATTSNCYSTMGNGTQATIVTGDQLASGEVTYMLNGGAEEDVIWFQTVGKDLHPVFDANHGIVKKDADGNYYTDSATAIDTIEGENVHQTTGIYNLQGQRLNKLQRGLIIVGGKKLLVK